MAACLISRGVLVTSPSMEWPRPSRGRVGCNGDAKSFAMASIRRFDYRALPCTLKLPYVMFVRSRAVVRLLSAECGGKGPPWAHIFCGFANGVDWFSL